MKKGKHDPFYVKKLQSQLDGLDLGKETAFSARPEKEPPFAGKKQQSDLYPLYYDLYRDLIETRCYYHESLGDITPGTQMHDWLMAEAVKVLVKSQVRVLDQPVCELLTDLMTKSGNTLVPYIPYPKYPMWLEFDKTAIGDTKTQFKAIWCFPQKQLVNNVMTDGILFQLIDMQGGAKGLFVYDGGWSYSQGGACENQACPKGGMTVEGETYYIYRQECTALCSVDCNCAGAAREMSKMVFLAGHLMYNMNTSKIIKEVAVSRQKKLPRKFGEQQLVKEWNKKHPHYVRLSLSQPRVEVKRINKVERTGQGGRRDYDHVELQQVAGSWRALIPGEGKPWKEFQLFYVDSFEREMPVSDNPTRYLYQK